MEIRRANRSDLDFASAIMQQTQNAHVEAFPHRYVPISEQTARSLLHATLEGEAEVVVATDGGVWLGYAIFEFVDVAGTPILRARRFCYLRDIGVAGEARRRGVARALIEHVRAASRRAGVLEVELDVWAFNAAGRQCFEKAGFEVFGTKMRASFDRRS